MTYYRPDASSSPIEALLDRVLPTEGAAQPSSDDQLPTLERFLEEEDILRECRGDNERLIAYLCQPAVVRALVSHAVTSKKVCMERYASNTPNPTQDTSDAAVAEEDNSVPVPTNPLKYPYIASELLSADIRELCDVVVADDQVMDLIFECVENNEPGHLDSFVATHFSKVIVSLLKTRNGPTLKQMRRRGKTFTDELMKHIALGPISELIVRLLDAPEQERHLDTSIQAPSPGALLLLKEADLLNGLADAFVQASHPMSDTESCAERRHREETLANVTSTITGLTERILQLPPLGVGIPEQLSAYHTPKAVARLLDAGLFAATSGSPPRHTPEPESPTGVAINTSSIVLSGNYSALLHSLSLAANLMTTKSNIWEEEKASYDVPPNSDSTTDGAENGVPDVGEMGSDADGVAGGASVGAIGTNSLLRPRTPGENIISTSLLEQELVVRFQRLAQMFGSLEQDSSAKLPLGSLRLKLAEFFTACMKKASRTTVEHIIELSVPKKLLDLFRRYEWSSMLHGVVTSSIIAALESGMSGLPARIAWFDAQLVGWLLAAWSSNERKESEEACRFRAGYMGHLIKIGAALRDYVAETEETNREALLQLVSEENVGKFKNFSENDLAPAHRIEVTPLCDNDSESEEIYEDEPTDLLEMGVGEVIEGLTQGDPDVAIQRFSKFLLHKSGGNIQLEEEEVVTSVDVGDLSHFGEDEEEEVEEVSGIDDHDLPPEMRRQLESEAAAAAAATNASRPNGRSSSSKETTDDVQDDGTYEAHMAKTASASDGGVDKLATSFEENVRIVEPLTIVDAAEDIVVPIPSPSLEVDAAVTEIEEPQPVTPSPLADVSPLTRGVASPGDANDDSSDDDLDNWVAFSEFEKQQDHSTKPKDDTAPPPAAAAPADAKLDAAPATAPAAVAVAAPIESCATTTTPSESAPPPETRS